MAEHEHVTLGVLAERVQGVRDDVTEIRDTQRQFTGRIRTVEDAVLTMVTEQRAARKAEARQYRRLAMAIKLGGLAMGFGTLVLAYITWRYHT